MKKIIIAIMLIIALSIAANAQQVLTTNFEEWKPFMFVENKEWKGVDAEILKMLIVDAGYILEIKTGYPFSRVMMMIDKGELSIVIGISKNEERMKTMLFSSSYRDSRKIVVSKKSDMIKILSDLKERRIGLVNEYNYSEIDGIVCKKEFVVNEIANYRKMNADRFDCFIVCDIFTHAQIIKENKEFEEFKVQSIELRGVGTYIAVSKLTNNATEIIDKLNKSMIKNKNSIKQIIEKYSR